MAVDPDSPYPESDFPWSLHFNGVPMPRWANCWHLVPLLERAEVFMSDWDLIGYAHLWRLHCRIDHVGGVESADPDVFRICSLALSFLMVRDEAAILDELSTSDYLYGGTPQELYSGVRDGLFAMHQLCTADGIAFWSAGYDTDHLLLTEAIRRHRLPQSDPEWLEAPHMSTDRFEKECRIRYLRGDLISLIGTRPIPKSVRRFIHELPKNA